MKIILTIKTGKGEKSTRKDVDKTVDEAIKILSFLEEKRYASLMCKCFSDGTQVTMEKK